MTNKEKIEEAKRLYQTANDDQKYVLERLFPELQESEDERIRKDLIKWIKEFPDSIWRGHYTKDVIVWLEKQGDNTYFWKPTKEQINALEHFVRSIGESGYASPYDDNTKLLKSLINDLYKLEKQGEQTSVINMITPEENLGIDSDTYNEIVDECIYGEQKPIIDGILTATNYDKMFQNCNGHKFKVGDWIVFNGLVLFIKEVVQGYYRTVSVGGIPNSYDWDIDNVARLWTIDDAKEGDVLAYVTDEEDLWIMIYWSLYAPYEGHVHYHALLVNDNFYDKGTCCICINDLKPATKEQRDLLYQKMKEAGYVWDDEKKEVRKVEK